MNTTSKSPKEARSQFIRISWFIFLFSFDFCSAGEENGPSENLGQVVFGERIRASPYKVSIYSQAYLHYKHFKCHLGLV